MLHNIINFFNGNKKALVIVCCLALGIVFLSFGSLSDNQPENDIGLADYKANLEAELKDACSSVQGVGRCRVVVSFSVGEENTYKGSNLISSRPPVVMGVTVICDGADSDTVRSEIVSMMTSLFELGSNRVAILKLK